MHKPPTVVFLELYLHAAARQGPWKDVSMHVPPTVVFLKLYLHAAARHVPWITSLILADMCRAEAFVRACSVHAADHKFAARAAWARVIVLGGHTDLGRESFSPKPLGGPLNPAFPA
jgi:hypothetical protein